MCRAVEVRARHESSYPTFELPMTSRMRHLIAPALLLLALSAPGGRTGQPRRRRARLRRGRLGGRQATPNADKRAALKKIPADLDEYSDCRSAISGSIGAGGPKAGSAKSRATPAAARPAASAAATAARPRSTPTPTATARSPTPRRPRPARPTWPSSRTASARTPRAPSATARPTPRKVGAIDASETSNGLPAPVIASIAALALLALAAGMFFLARRKPGFAQAMRRVPRPGLSSAASPASSRSPSRRSRSEQPAGRRSAARRPPRRIVILAAGVLLAVAIPSFDTRAAALRRHRASRC